MVTRNNFCGFKFHGEVSQVWERDPSKADDVIQTLPFPWFFCLGTRLRPTMSMECSHASARMATVSILVLPYVATWAFSSAANKRYWPHFFIRVSARLVTEDSVNRSRGPYQRDTGSEREQ